MLYSTNYFPLVSMFSACISQVGLFVHFICCIFTFVFLLCMSTLCVFRAGGRTQRAASWQLRQENSDAVWNELTYLKNLNRKLSTEK